MVVKVSAESYRNARKEEWLVSEPIRKGFTETVTFEHEEWISIYQDKKKK